MTQEAQERPWWRAPLMWALLLVGVGATFAHTFVEMWARWFPAWRYPELGLYGRIVEGASYYTHAPLVPLVSLVAAMLIVRHTRMPVRPARGAGWSVLVGSLVVHLLACLARVNFISGFALLGVIAGLILLLWGGEAMRRLWFPVAFLAFMVPLPDLTIVNWNFALRTWAAQAGVAVADFLGVVVVRAGNRVHLHPDKILEIADVCNGLRTIISLLAFGALYAYVCRLRGLWRLGLFASTILVALVANTVRIVGLILVADAWDVQTATGWFHDSSGILIFVLAFLMMFGLERLVLWARRAVGRPAVVLPLFHAVRRSEQDEEQGVLLARAPASTRGLAVTGCLMVALAGTVWLDRSIPPMWNGQMARAAVPRQVRIGGNTWDSYDLKLDEKALRELETHDYLCRKYVTANVRPPVEFVVIFSPDNRKGTHPPDVCRAERIERKESASVDGVEGRGTVPCRGLLLRSGAGYEYLLYTYKCGSEYTASFWWQQLVILWNGLTNRNASGALIWYMTPIEGTDEAGARQRCADFLRATIPHLDRSLP